MNAIDKVSKSRQAKGEETNHNKLVTADTHEIFRLNALGVSQSQIGRMFGVVSETIWHVLARKTWKHVEVTHG